MDFKDLQLSADMEVYNECFCKMLKGINKHPDILDKAKNTLNGSYIMPVSMQKKFDDEICKQSIFRQLGTYVKAYNHGSRIFADECNDLAEFVPEFGEIHIYDMMDDFKRLTVDSHKLAVFTKLSEDFIREATFDMEKYLIKRFAKNFDRAEENAFINGTGVDMPTGILCDNGGAEIGKETSNLYYDDIIDLYFSVKPEYRKNGVWMMNDETAMKLRKLRDEDGNYIWNNNDDTILGKKVVISNYMPSTGKVIAFGDFSYYWVIGRMPVSVNTLKEKFVINDQLGYLAIEYIDGKLLRTDAVKVIKLTA